MTQSADLLSFSMVKGIGAIEIRFYARWGPMFSWYLLFPARLEHGFDSRAMAELTHFDSDGNARMVAVSDKQVTRRTARVSGVVQMRPETRQQIADRSLAKGDVIAVARLAGIMAAKKTSDLIPLCHPISLDSVELEFEYQGDASIIVRATVIADQKTGVEMEAFTAVSVACLTIYDMCKSSDRSMSVSEIRLEHKSGGKSGDYNYHASSQ